MSDGNTRIAKTSSTCAMNLEFTQSGIFFLLHRTGSQQVMVLEELLKELQLRFVCSIPLTTTS